MEWGCTKRRKLKREGREGQIQRETDEEVEREGARPGLVQRQVLEALPTPVVTAGLGAVSEVESGRHVFYA